MTRTVCIGGLSRQQIEAAGIIYVGRDNPRYGLKGHALANPFRVGRDGAAGECVRRYREYLLARLDLLAICETLHGATLGCWCNQEAGDCHAKVISGVADGIVK